MCLLGLEAWAVFLLHYRSNFLLQHWQKQRLYLSWKNISGTWDHVYLRHPRLSVDVYPWSILSINTWSLDGHLINTLDQHLINTQLTLDQYSVDPPSASWLTLDQHLGWQSVRIPLIFIWYTSWLTLSQLLTGCQSSVTVRLPFPFY